MRYILPPLFLCVLLTSPAFCQTTIQRITDFYASVKRPDVTPQEIIAKIQNLRTISLVSSENDAIEIFATILSLKYAYKTRIPSPNLIEPEVDLFIKGCTDKQRTRGYARYVSRRNADFDHAESLYEELAKLVTANPQYLTDGDVDRLCWMYRGYGASSTGPLEELIHVLAMPAYKNIVDQHRIEFFRSWWENPLTVNGCIILLDGNGSENKQYYLDVLEGLIKRVKANGWSNDNRKRCRVTWAVLIKPEGGGLNSLFSYRPNDFMGWNEVSTYSDSIAQLMNQKLLYCVKEIIDESYRLEGDLSSARPADLYQIAAFCRNWEGKYSKETLSNWQQFLSSRYMGDRELAQITIAAISEK